MVPKLSLTFVTWSSEKSSNLVNRIHVASKDKTNQLITFFDQKSRHPKRPNILSIFNRRRSLFSFFDQRRATLKCHLGFLINVLVTRRGPARSGGRGGGKGSWVLRGPVMLRLQSVRNYKLVRVSEIPR